MFARIDGKLYESTDIVCSYLDYGYRDSRVSELFSFEFSLTDEEFKDAFGQQIDDYIKDCELDYRDEDDDFFSLKRLKDIGFERSEVLFQKHPEVLSGLLEDFFRVDFLSEIMPVTSQQSGLFLVHICESISIRNKEMIIKGKARKLKAL